MTIGEMASMDLIQRASSLTVSDAFGAQVRRHPRAIAIEDGRGLLAYAELDERVNRLSNALLSLRIARGDRIAVLSENRAEYLEIELAAGRVGAIVACQNWRLADPELLHCLRLVKPKLVVVSQRFAGTLARIEHGADRIVVLGEAYERMLARASAALPHCGDRTVAEDGLIILYTSGTTGLPKGALISHRAMVARCMIQSMDRPADPHDAFVAWTPLFHMGATDASLATLMRGGKVIVLDGFDAGRLVDAVCRERINHLSVVPGVVDRVIAELQRSRARPRGVATVGVMPDLVPPQQIAELTTLLQAPYCNTFGSTETGSPPASRNLIGIGVAPTSLSKEQSSCCDIRLVDEDGVEVSDGEPGEMTMRGPSLFSGYWDSPEANAAAFHHGWYHMGDVFVRNASRTLDFIDRRKYLIKSGGENIYPSEIERVLLALPAVSDAVVVRRPDARWGEVPIAFVVPRGAGLTEADVIAACRSAIAGYKVPKEVRLVTPEALPRSLTGKIMRHELEQRLRAELRTT